MDAKKKKIIVSSVLYGVIAIIVAICIVGTIFARRYNRNITALLCGSGIQAPMDKGKYDPKLGADLGKVAGADAMVLLKNEDDVLPLEKNANVNVFGAGSADQNWKVTGIGSGTGVIRDEDKHTFMRSLKDAGFKVNEQLEQYYAGLPGVTSGTNNHYVLSEPSVTALGKVVDDSKATQFSDTAIVVLGRNAGETIPEIPLKQASGNNSNDKTYLEVTDQEDELLRYLKNTAKFEKIIVIVNAANAMNLDFVDMPEYGVSACLYAGFTGQSGADAIGKILCGDVNPSGRTSDVYVYAATNHRFDPTWFNNRNVDMSIQQPTKNMVEAENIYYGYKWYETADVEGALRTAGNTFGKGYDAVVQYPFGYGLDYTDFEWKVKSVSPAVNSALALDTEISITVEVTNKGPKAGKDVVELYSNPPYTPGGIEKAAVNLVAFEKTPLIQPNGKAEVTLKVSAFELASFDCWDLNENGKTSWELDDGDYELTLRTDSHTVADDVMASGSNATLTYKVNSTLVYDKDPVGGGEIDTRLTGDNAYAGVSVDGTNVGLTKENYLSRNNSFANFASTCNKRTDGPSGEKVQAARAYMNPTYETDAMPTTSSTTTDHRIVTVEGGGKATAAQLNGKDTSVELEYNKELIHELAADFGADKWKQMVEQMSVSELKNLFHFAGFQTYEAESVGKLKNIDYDGPAGFNLTALKGKWEGGAAAAEEIEKDWTVWPSESLLGCSWNKNLLLEIGLFMGMEASISSVSGWYAPGMNLHRTAYTNRNFEYYSEDSVLTGYLAANVVHGAKMNNLYCYMKHFVCCEYGANPTETDTWLTEQSLRENPMRAFEIAVKKGHGNAIMTSFNNVGPVWSGANYATCTQILRDEWGFKGTLLTDICSLGSAYGIGKFSHTQGLRSGQDIWLNNSVTMFDDINDKDPTMIAVAQRAAKNVLWTVVDTYNYASTYDRTQLDAIFGDTGETSQKYAIELSVRVAPTVFAWWIPVAITLEVLVLCGCAVWVFFITRSLVKFLKQQPEPQPEAKE